jgi:epsilon-lactone hydrolase
MRSTELQTITELLLAEQRSMDPAERTVEARRKRLDGLADIFPLPDDVERSELELGGVRSVRLEPPGAGDDVLLYLHGGGYGGGSPKSHSELAARLARAAGAVAIVPGYRLAPEYTYPAALDDAIAAYRALLDEVGDANRLVLAGDSAGGGLSVAVCVALREVGEPLPRALSLLSPWLDLTCTSPSWDSRLEGDPILDHHLREAAERYLDGADPRDPLCSPLFADLTGMPPTLVLVGTHEILYDDAVSFAQVAAEQGVEVELEIGHELIHVWPIFPITPEAVASTVRIGRFLGTKNG